MAHAYEWAANPTKVQNSVAALEAKKKLDPKFEFGEAEIKEEYVKRGGLVLEVQDKERGDGEETPKKRGRKAAEAEDSNEE